MNLQRIIGLGLIFSVLVWMAGCTQKDSPKGVSQQFWEAVQARDMEAAKQVSTWDTVDYLKYLKTEKLHPERYDLGDEMLGENHAEIVTTLYTTRQGKSGIKVPGVTVLEKTNHGWRVNVKKTLGSVVKQTLDNVFEQLNGLMKEGINELDKSFSESINEIGKALEEGAQELKKELSKPLLPPNRNLNQGNNYPKKI